MLHAECSFERIPGSVALAWDKLAGTSAHQGPDRDLGSFAYQVAFFTLVASRMQWQPAKQRVLQRWALKL